jgi:hypothetical protein
MQLAFQRQKGRFGVSVIECGIRRHIYGSIVIIIVIIIFFIVIFFVVIFFVVIFVIFFVIFVRLLVRLLNLSSFLAYIRDT